METIEITTFNGEKILGFLCSFNNLPKKAKLIKYTYDESFNTFGIYASFFKNKTKYYLIKTI